MPKPRQEDTMAGQIEPTFNWETRIPHTVVLMLKSTEEDLILKACQSLYKFAHEGELNQNLLIQYDILVLLLDHLEHPNRNVRRMSAMTLSELSANNSVQSVLVSSENVVRLVRVLREDDDCVVDEVASSALLRLASDATGRAMLLGYEAVGSLVKRLTSKDPDVLKNCLDTLLVLLDFPQAVQTFVESGGVSNALGLLGSDYPVLQSLSLSALRKAMRSEGGRIAIRDEGGLEKLITLLEDPKLEDLHSSSLSVLDGAILDINNIHAIHEFGGLVNLLTFIQTTTVLDVLEQCGFLLAKMSENAEVREIFHELSVEPVLVSSLLATGHAGSQNGAARAVGHMCHMLEAQEELVRLDVVTILLSMVSNPEAFQSAVMALAAATHNHQQACRQVCGSGQLEQLVGRLGIHDDETVSHTATALRNLSEQETLRPVVAASSAPERLVACLAADSPAVLVSVCDALGVLCLNLSARRQVVQYDAAQLFMDLLEHESGAVRDACVRTLQVIGSDFSAAEQLCSGGAIGSLRRLRATSTLKIIMEVNLSALYSIFGRLGVRHKLYDLFFDCGRQETCEAVPDLATLMEQPLSHTRLVYLLHSGACPYVSDEGRPAADHAQPPHRQEEIATDGQSAEQVATEQGQLVTERPPSDRTLEGVRQQHTEGEPAEAAKSSTSEGEPEQVRPLPDARLAAYVEHARLVVQPLACDRAQSSALAQFVAQRLGGACGTLACRAPYGAVAPGRHWNTVLLRGERQMALLGPYLDTVVDLMHEPGRLMPADSADAVEYTSGLGSRH
ncbi:armadillo repeat-containing protein 3-like [Pollicipes pollicipes]|uniref:armadillo repeat-containing protein 3-like n=1 Tax=Pollicipes pollicipes TaxID=41117 RepID=UPI00188558F6|nr:armadillo repeat-containing protein 3-like [Pollicipes pollicipes]